MEGLKKGLSGSALKWLAITTMLIDHIGAVVLTRILVYYHYAPDLSIYDDSYSILYNIMVVTRTIGRLAFPIFCFLLVEGFQKTGNKYKYMLRMALFTVLAEIPFDLALSGKMFYWGYQNVMLTLLIGMLTMWGCSLMEEQFAQRKLLLIAGCALCTGLGMLSAHFLQTDYAAKGILCIMVLYFFRHNRLWQSLTGALSLIWEAEAMISFLFIYQYNGQRGRQMKYLFYFFYPLHLLILYFICYVFKIHWISVI